jgi:arylsulfatase A-like enzyme
MDECTYIDENYNYQFVLKSKYLDPLIEAKQRCLRTKKWKLVCTPTAAKGRHFGLFQMISDPHGERDVAKDRPEVLTPMKAALERWMDLKAESSIREIFPGGEPS